MVTVPTTIGQALAKVVERLDGADVNWAITGSLGFRLQGVPVDVHDIDLQTDGAGAYKIEDLLCEYSTEKVGFSTSGNIRSHFGVLEIGGVRVEIMGDVQKLLSDGSWEDPIDPAEHRLSVETEGIQVPVLNLAYECSAYEALGRSDRADFLRNWLRENRASS